MAAGGARVDEVEEEVGAEVEGGAARLRLPS